MTARYAITLTLESDITLNDARQLAETLPWWIRYVDRAVVHDASSQAPLEVLPPAVAVAENEYHRLIVTHRGRAEQLERFDAGVLPLEEILALVREVAFAPFGDAPRFKRFTCHDAEHEVDCVFYGVPSSIDDSDVTYDTIPLPALNGEQWAKCKKFRHQGNLVHGHWINVVVSEDIDSGLGAVRVDAKQHCVTCDACGKTVKRPSIMVAIEWAGHILTREYAL